MKKVFVAATRQNDGKTTVSLGLFSAFRKRYPNIGYMKPVGQQFKIVDGKKIDKDAVLFYKTFDLQDPIQDISPIAVPRGFTEGYINNPHRQQLADSITHSFDKISVDKEFCLFEGTGHAGVGSVFDMSNADVAKLVGSKVILVSIGGIGRSIDEIFLNKSLFELAGVELAGVIINKVHEDKYDKIKDTVTRGLARFDIPVLGVIPLVTSLTYPSVGELVEVLCADVLTGDDGMSNVAEKFLIGDMVPHNALDFFKPNTVLIIPGNREELILTALLGNILENAVVYYISAIVFTNGIKPHKKILDLIKRTHIPILLVEEDSFHVASRLNQMIFKIRSQDLDKIHTIEKLVDEYVDIDQVEAQL